MERLLLQICPDPLKIGYLFFFTKIFCRKKVYLVHFRSKKISFCEQSNFVSSNEFVKKTLQKIYTGLCFIFQEFILQKANLTTRKFIALITEITSLGENSTETDKITNATKTIQYYISNINNADYLKTYSLNRLLVKALLSINRNLDCLRAKLSVIALAIRDCLDGIESMAYIFKKVKDFEKTKVQKECITNGYIRTLRMTLTLRM